jgi:hypothetical protein
VALQKESVSKYLFKMPQIPKFHLIRYRQKSAGLLVQNSDRPIAKMEKGSTVNAD